MESKIKFCGFEQSLATQHVCALIRPRVDEVSLRRGCTEVVLGINNSARDGVFLKTASSSSVDLFLKQNGKVMIRKKFPPPVCSPCHAPSVLHRIPAFAVFIL